MITKTTEWEGEHTRLVKLTGLPQSSRGYAKRKSRVSVVFVHQSAGNFREGLDAPESIARFHTSPPRYKLNSDGSIKYRTVRGKKRKQWIGGGRGWPGCGYTFIVPGAPQIVGGKIEVYRAHDDDRHTYHTGGLYNRIGVAVCFAGTFTSRHTRPSKRERKAPEPDAMLAGQELILDYLLPRYGIDPREGLKGHFDAGKAACPGDYLESWVRSQRGEEVAAPRSPADDDPAVIVRADARTFDTIAERQQALLDLGFDLGRWGADGQWGGASKGALLAFQATAEIAVDGRWGRQTEAAVRLALAAQTAGQWPPGDT